MKKYFALLLSLFIMLSLQGVFAEGWDDFADLDRAWDGQKTITNKEFEQVMDNLQAKQKRKEARKKKRRAKKISGGGTSLHAELNPDKEINEVQIAPKDEGNIINLSVCLITDGKIIDKGYYKVLAERGENNCIYLMFYQSHSLMGKIKAAETEEDFNKETVNFADVLPYNDRFVKLIYGSIDFNACAVVPFSE